MKKNLNKLSELLNSPLRRLGAVTSIFVLIWFVSILIMQNQMNKNKLSLDKNRVEIDQISKLLGSAATISIGKEEFVHQLDLLNSKLPVKEDAALNALSELAKSIRLNVLTIKAQEKHAYVNSSGQKVVIDGKECQELGVSIILEGNYLNFFQFIYKIPGSIPALIKIENIKIQRNPQKPTALTISVDFKLYMLV